MIVIPHNVQLCEQYFLQECLLLNRKSCNSFSVIVSWKRPLWELKLVKSRKTSIFIVNKRLREAEVKFLIQHDKKEFKYCITTLYTEETPDTNISDTSNELKQVLAHNCLYISGKAKTYISEAHTHFRGVLELIPFPKAINPLTVTLMFF